TGLMQPTMKPIRDARPLGDVLLSVGRAVLGTEEGKGPLPWPGFEPYLRQAWEPLVKGDLAAAQRQGGVWRDVPAAAVGGARAREARGRRRRLRAARLPVAADVRRPRRLARLAAGGARSDHLGGLGRVGGDRERDREVARHRARRRRARDVAPRRDRAARVSDADPSPQGG